MSLKLALTFGAVALGTGGWLWLLRRYDRIETESVANLVQVVVLGGVASMAAAALLNEGFARATGLEALLTGAVGGASGGALVAFSLFVGVSEEVTKAVATVYVTRRWGDLDEPVDAMIYAMSVGLGFAALESVFYASRFGNEVLLMRFLWPVPAHMAYASLWGYGLAKARYVFPERNRAAVMGPSVALGAGVHAAANVLLLLQSTLSAFWGTAAALMSLGALFVLAYVAHEHMHELLAESPFLDPGECPECRHRNPPQARRCTRCGTPLKQTSMFTTCPCGQIRVPVRTDDCPRCGLDLREAESAAEPPPAPGVERTP
jgi:RsiW-degrading membrane proteinase PrsW (M82 family)